MRAVLVPEQIALADPVRLDGNAVGELAEKLVGEILGLAEVGAGGTLRRLRPRSKPAAAGQERGEEHKTNEQTRTTHGQRHGELLHSMNYIRRRGARQRSRRRCADFPTRAEEIKRMTC